MLRQPFKVKKVCQQRTTRVLFIRSNFKARVMIIFDKLQSSTENSHQSGIISVQKVSKGPSDTFATS